jgi:hypothetical protein
MKVFLSSTYNDLIEHRKAAHDALEQLGLNVIWMEAFGARTEDSTTACLKEVEESDCLWDLRPSLRICSKTFPSPSRNLIRQKTWKTDLWIYR